MPVKPKTKTLICVDCGTPFEIKSSNKKTIRCRECQRKETNRQKAIEKIKSRRMGKYKKSKLNF